jgi:hypothetical protein
MEEIYKIIDSFLVEAKDQNGNERSLERLNQDRHLAAERIIDWHKEKLVEFLKRMLKDFSDDIGLEFNGREIKNIILTNSSYFMKSKCCLADIKVGGDGTTHYHICKKCGNPCDVFIGGHKPDWDKIEKVSKELNAEDLRSCAQESVEFSNFCQKFKMEWWKRDDHEHVPEKVLDELAIIAYDLLNK